MSAASRRGKGGKAAEQEVQRRLDAGQTRRQIVGETDIAPSIIDRVAGHNGDGELRTRRTGGQKGSERLAAAVLSARNEGYADAALASKRRHLRDFTVRPLAASHEPCSFCGVRGDVGCRHQLPCEGGL